MSEILTLSRLLLCIDWLTILHTGTHSINGLALLRALVHHHWGTTRRARVSIGHHWWWMSILRNEMALTSWVHLHWWPRRNHTLWTRHETITRRTRNHDRGTHMGWLLWVEMLVTRVRSVLGHLRCPCSHGVLHGLLVICELCVLIHWRRVDQWDLLQARRGKGLSRVRWGHLVIIWSKMWLALMVGVHMHLWLTWGWSLGHSTLLEVKW